MKLLSHFLSYSYVTLINMSIHFILFNPMHLSFIYQLFILAFFTSFLILIPNLLPYSTYTFIYFFFTPFLFIYPTSLPFSIPLCRLCTIFASFLLIYSTFLLSFLRYFLLYPLILLPTLLSNLCHFLSRFILSLSLFNHLDLKYIPDSGNTISAEIYWRRLHQTAIISLCYHIILL